MGTLRYPPTAELVRKLRDRFDIRVVIETGTYKGDSTAFAAEMFEQVITVDISAEYQNEGIVNCRSFSNIVYLTGDTRSLLPTVVSKLTGTALFWLDAHSVAGLTGVVDDCPLLEELDIINRSAFDHVILIDDAHCFQPQSNGVWPSKAAIMGKALRRGCTMWENHDVIVIASSAAQEDIVEFMIDITVDATVRNLAIEALGGCSL